jgi:rhomboid family GlyGly-CTERM serine protease
VDVGTTTHLTRLAPLLVLLGAVLLTSVGGALLRDVLAWDRVRIADGELWRLVTGHLVHANARHALVNAAALVLLLLWPVSRTLGAPSWWRAIAVTSLAISLGLFLPAWPVTYVGASGVLHGLFAFALVAGRGPARIDALLLAALWAKIAFEQIVGPSPQVGAWLGVRTAVDAHLIGAAAGTMLGARERLHH